MQIIFLFKDVQSRGNLCSNVRILPLLQYEGHKAQILIEDSPWSTDSFRLKKIYLQPEYWVSRPVFSNHDDDISLF